MIASQELKISVLSIQLLGRMQMPSPEFQAPPKLGPFQWIEGKFEHFWLYIWLYTIHYYTVYCIPHFQLTGGNWLQLLRDWTSKSFERKRSHGLDVKIIASTTAATFSSSKSDCSSGSDIRSLFLKLWRCLVFVETKLDFTGNNTATRSVGQNSHPAGLRPLAHRPVQNADKPRHGSEEEQGLS